jgi:hypothetical protein
MVPGQGVNGLPLNGYGIREQPEALEAAGGGSSHDAVSTLTLEVARLLGAGHLATLMMGTYMLLRTSRQLNPILEVINEHNSCCNHPAKDTQADAAPNNQGRARTR